ncbi:sulfite exporter TauE/SafE family protein [bacterium]|nr:sulfite exporter TauE/SafE family protein [bacterium]
MFRRFRNSWELAKASIAVLKTDKELLVFPLISGLCVLIVSASFIVPSMLIGLFEHATTEQGLGPIHYLLIFMFYISQYFVIIFFNSALIGAALMRLRGDDPTVADGFKIAFTHLGNIIGYAIIAATIGLILRWLAERGKIGQFVASLVGLAWNLAVFLAVPILVSEGISPLEAIKKSTQLLKKTWGEQIVGNMGVGFIFGLIYCIIILSGVGLAVLIAGTGSTPLLVGFIIAVIVSIVVIAIIQSALQGIYVAAVYQYASTGETSHFFEQQQITNAFRQK